MKMTSKWIAGSVMAIGLAATGSAAFAQYGYPQQGYEQPRRDWGYEARNYENDFEHRGFRDGMVGAQRDFENRRRPDVRNRDEYRDPDFIPREFRHEYQEGFEKGYWAGVRRMSGNDEREYDRR